jgi:geranyl diphosphate synthase
LLHVQVIDDVLDFTGESSVMGKPTLGDIKAGVITCPVLFAADEHPELLPMIARKFHEPGDLDVAIDLVKRSDGVQRSRQLAQAYMQAALDCLDDFGPCESGHALEARHALQQLCCRVVQRDK